MVTKHNQYEVSLDKNAANYVPLTPLSFIERAKDVYPGYTALVYGGRVYSWLETYNRCLKFASALERHGIGVGDTVSILAANTPEIFETHHSVPMSGAILNTINTRLEADTIAYILNHSDAKVLITDTQYSPTVKSALTKLDSNILVIDIRDPDAILQEGEGECLGKFTYDEFMAAGSLDYQPRTPEDEWQAITLNYTSGTTGRPKGVVYHHRGSYLMTMGSVIAWNMPNHPRYLYTVPMFHCNGWGYPWTLAALAGTAVCCRYIVAKDIIISGGENISSVEVENVLSKHPAVSLVAVVARPDEKWGETPCAFVELNPGNAETTEAELIDFCRERMAGFKRPKKIVFCELPKTSTGKIQKYTLRKRAAEV